MVDAVTRLRRVADGEDRYNNPLYTETVTELAPALFAPKDVIPPSEPGREPVVVEPTLYWRNEWPDVVASDRLIVRGKTYNVQSIPADWRGSNVGGLVVKLHASEDGVP